MKRKIKRRIDFHKDKYFRRSIFTVSMVLLFILVAFLVVFFWFTPKIKLTLNHKELGNTITLNYKSKYQKPAYQAFYQNEEITDQIKISGEVDTEKIGDYKIHYKVKDGLFFKERVLTVRVRDLSAPSIKLIGLDKAYVCPNQEYEEEGFKAYDNKDGDITKRVKVALKDDRVVYSVVDQAGNKKEEIRKLIYKDISAPVLELKGSRYETVYLNDKFTDPGVQAVDSCDGDITKNIEVKGKVDMSKCGTYTLTYIAKDHAGNEGRVERVVNVVSPGQNGTIYLTFDDGPKQGTTDAILDILKEENVKATFFITNNGPDELVVREHQEGHTVGLHTASHDYSYVYSSVQNYYNDLYSVRDRVKRLTGEDANIIRFPGGASNTVSRKYTKGIMSILTKDVLTKGFRYYDWNLASGDAGELKTAEGIFNQVTKNLSKERINIVLMHDIKPYTRDALRNIIHYAKENGYTFDRITENTEMMSQRVNN